MRGRNFALLACGLQSIFSHTISSRIVRHPVRMLGPTEFRDLVSGRRRGLGAAALRGLLRVAEVPYTLAVTLRNRRYDRGHAERASCRRAGHQRRQSHARRHRQDADGEMARARLRERRLARGDRQPRLRRRRRPAKRRSARACPGAARRAARAKPRPRRRGPARPSTNSIRKCMLLDDGFQHRRLARDLDIVLLDALEPFGFDHVFPRGTLREPVTGLARAHVVCLSRADAISAAERDAIRTPRRRTRSRKPPGASWPTRPAASSTSAAKRSRSNTSPASASPRSAASATRPAFATRSPRPAAKSPPGASFPITTLTRPPTSRNRSPAAIACKRAIRSSARRRIW